MTKRHTRLEGETSDLHTPDHERPATIKNEFNNRKSIEAAQKDNPVKSPEEYAMRSVIRTCRNEPDNVWTLVQLRLLYMKDEIFMSRESKQYDVDE